MILEKFAIPLLLAIAVAMVGCESPAERVGSPGLVAQLDAAIQGSIPPEAVQLNDAGVKAVERRDYKLAISKLEAAVKLAPDYKMARENLGIAYNNYGLQLQTKPLDSIKQFHKAVYLDPQNDTTIANYEGIIGYLRKNPKSFADRVALGEQAMAAGDWFGGVVEYFNALRLQDDRQARSKLAAARKKLGVYLSGTGLPESPFWDTLPNAAPSNAPEGEDPLQQAKELYEQYVLASDSHNPGIMDYYAKTATFAMGGSDPHSMTAKMEIPAQQWKQRYLTRQRADGVANRKDRFENVAYRVEKGGVHVSFTRVDPQVAARVEWLVKSDPDRKWRIFEQTELAVPAPGLH